MANRRRVVEMNEPVSCALEHCQGLIGDGGEVLEFVYAGKPGIKMYTHYDCGDEFCGSEYSKSGATLVGRIAVIRYKGEMTA